MAHEINDLVEFCMNKQIHLMNFPSKTSHILQPLDKLFGILKHKIQTRAREAALFFKGSVNETKTPILLRFAVEAMRSDAIKESFKKTGVCLLNGDAIDVDLLVRDDRASTATSISNSDSAPPDSTIADANSSSGNNTVSYLNVSSPSLDMHVYDDDAEIIVTEQKEQGNQRWQTSPAAPPGGLGHSPTF